MLKKLTLIIIGIFITFSIMACSKNEKSSDKLEQNITVITTYPQEIMEFISEQFKSRTGITIDYKIVKDNIENNIKETNDIDFILGGDKSVYIELAKNGRLKSFKTSWYDKIDNDNKDENGNWYAVSQNPIILFYNKRNILNQNVPKSWLELSYSNFKNKIIIENTNNEYVQDLLCALMYQYNKDGKIKEGTEYLGNLKNNIMTYIDNKESLFEELLNKDTPIGVTTLNNYMENKKNNEENFIIANLEEGVPVINECAAIINNSPHPNTSQLFMEFVAGPWMQVELAKNFSIIPSYSESISYGKNWMKELPKAMDVDWNIVEENKSLWIKIFNDIEKQEINNIHNNKIKNTKKLL